MKRHSSQPRKISAPEGLAGKHDLRDFNSGEPALDNWLRRSGRASQLAGAARTFVVCQGTRVVGYYSLAASSVLVDQTTKRVREKMPDPIPVVVIGRLAVDVNFQRKGLGRALLRDAILRTLGAADTIGVRAIVVHAISDEARAFYNSAGFAASPIDPMTLMVTIGDARKALGD